jgi:hypothetical protein
MAVAIGGREGAEGGRREVFAAGDEDVEFAAVALETEERDVVAFEIECATAEGAEVGEGGRKLAREWTAAGGEPVTEFVDVGGAFLEEETMFDEIEGEFVEGVAADGGEGPPGGDGGQHEEGGGGREPERARPAGRATRRGEGGAGAGEDGFAEAGRRRESCEFSSDGGVEGLVAFEPAGEIGIAAHLFESGRECGIGEVLSARPAGVKEEAGFCVVHEDFVRLEGSNGTILASADAEGSARRRRSWALPRERRDITVPMGMSSVWAIS